MSDVVIGLLGLAMAVLLFRQAWKDAAMARVEEHQRRTDRRLDEAGIPDVE